MAADSLNLCMVAGRVFTYRFVQKEEVALTDGHLAVMDKLVTSLHQLLQALTHLAATDRLVTSLHVTYTVVTSIDNMTPGSEGQACYIVTSTIVTSADRWTPGSEGHACYIVTCYIQLLHGLWQPGTSSLHVTYTVVSSIDTRKPGSKGQLITHRHNTNKQALHRV